MPRKIDVKTMRLYEPKPPYYKETRKGLITLLGDKQDRLNATLNELERMTIFMNEKRDALVKAEELLEMQRQSIEAAAQTIRELQVQCEDQKRIAKSHAETISQRQSSLDLANRMVADLSAKLADQHRYVQEYRDEAGEMKDNFVRAVAALLGRE